MKRTCILALVAIGTVALTGCGTVANFASGVPEKYGGVKKDVEWIRTPSSGIEGGGGSNWVVPAAILAFTAAELSLSAVADTLTLPVITYRERQRDAHDEQIGRDYPDRHVQFSTGGFDPKSPPSPPVIATSPAAR